MIVEALLKLLVGIVRFIVGLFPDGEAPSWMGGANTALAAVWSYGSGLGVWVPFNLLGQVFSAVLICVTIGFTIRTVRIVASFFTGGGGSAA